MEDGGKSQEYLALIISEISYKNKKYILFRLTI